MIINGRAKKTTGHQKPMPEWSVLIRDHHPCYINWEEFEQNQRMISENAHMQKRADRKSARGGRALLAGLVRCGRCGRMMRVFYGSTAGHAHRYQCAAISTPLVARSALALVESAWIERWPVRSWKQSRLMRLRPPLVAAERCKTVEDDSASPGQGNGSGPLRSIPGGASL